MVSRLSSLVAHIKAEYTLALMPELTKTACKGWLVERLDPPSITESVFDSQ